MLQVDDYINLSCTNENCKPIVMIDHTTSLSPDGANSFHEKAGECQDFSFIFSLFFSFCFIYFFFFQIVPIQPSRLCRHPSIRTLC